MIGYQKETAWATQQSVPALVRGLMAALAAGLLALAGCATPGGPTPTGADAGTVMKAYGDYKAAWERRDVAAIVGCYHQNGSLDNSAAGGAVSGPAFAGWLQGLFAAIPDFRVEVLSAGMVGDQRVADQWVIKGTWTKPFPGGPLAGAHPTGKSFTVAGASFYEWKGGKIVTGVQYFDQMHLAIWVMGQRFRFFANSELLFEIRDPKLPAGGLGVFVRSASDETLTVNFSELAVYALQPVTETPTPSPISLETALPTP